MTAARIITGLLFCLAFAVHPVASATPISGSWELDREQSDNVRKLLHSKSKKGKKHGDQGKNHGDKGREPGGSPHPAQGSEPNPFPLLSANTLRIRADNDQVEITPDEGLPIRIVPDGRAQPVSLSNWGNKGNPPVRFSVWEGDTLVMESSLDEGTHITQRYYVSEQGLLVQATEINRTHGKPVVVKRRFKPANKQPAAH